MLPELFPHLDTLARLSAKRISQWVQRFRSYIRRLVFPLYLFPVKLVTYSAYYVVRFSVRLAVSLIIISLEMLIYPFRGLRQFLKSVFVLAVVAYMLASLFVITDYLRTQYGASGKFLCSYGVREKLRESVVRIVGGYSEGTGFFISENRILTNFHVIADEPSPKVIFPDGTFLTPIAIMGNKDADLAVLTTEKRFPSMVLPLPEEELRIYRDEPLLATGYPLGTTLVGQATTAEGRFIAFRQSRKDPMVYIHTGVSLVKGMSGGPLTDTCGTVVGVNTMTLAGLSLFISGYQARQLLPDMTDQNITKLVVDPSASPEAAVQAMYTYLKARKMTEGFALLSREYLQKTSLEEWTGRFTDILDVDVFVTRPAPGQRDTVFVKFGTKNWVDNETDVHYYEGTWQTVREDGVYKLLRSHITEVDHPSWDWFYE